MNLVGNWSYPTSVRFGAGRIAELAAAVRSAGITKPLFVTDPKLAATPMVNDACGLLDAAGISTKLFADVRPNPVGANIEAGVAAFRAGGHDGVVALVGSSSSGYGNYVVIAHSGGLNTLYGHLSTSLVKVGQSVTQGTPVGLEGSTGNSTGAHLHFELRINQSPVNPAPYLPPGAPSAFRG